MTADLVENFMLDDNDLEEKVVKISETSRNMDEFSLQDAGQVCDAEDLVSEVSDSQTVTRHDCANLYSQLLFFYLSTLLFSFFFGGMSFLTKH